MSKIIKKRELDLVIENVLKENGIIVEAEDVEITVSDDETEVKHGKKEVEIEDTDAMDETEEMDEDCDVVEESTNKLKTSIKDSTTKLIKEDLDNFKRLMNHRN